MKPPSNTMRPGQGQDTVEKEDRSRKIDNKDEEKEKKRRDRRKRR